MVLFQELMAPTRRPAMRSTSAAPSEVPEHSRSDEEQELRAQVAALVGMVQHQEDRFERLRELMERRVAAVAVTTLEGRDSPAPSARAPNVTKGMDIAAAPVAAHPPPACIPPTASGSSILDVATEEAEK